MNNTYTKSDTASSGKLSIILVILGLVLFLCGLALSFLIQEPVMPGVVGMEKDKAINRLQDLGLAVTIEEKYDANSNFPAGEVMAQDPSAGTEIANGDNAKIIVSKGPKPNDEEVDPEEIFESEALEDSPDSADKFEDGFFHKKGGSSSNSSGIYSGSGTSGDTTGGSDDTTGGSGDTTGGSGDTTGGSSDNTGGGGTDTVAES